MFVIKSVPVEFRPLSGMLCGVPIFCDIVKTVVWKMAIIFP